jgi:hypothetical protein
VHAAAAQQVTLLVDVANVLGSRPDGWWRDRAGATSRLLDRLDAVVGRDVTGPDGAPLHVADVLAVLEGKARGATAPAGVRVVLADRDGDREVVEQARGLAEHSRPVLVVTADRGLRAALPAAVDVAGPGWLNGLLGR